VRYDDDADDDVAWSKTSAVDQNGLVSDCDRQSSSVGLFDQFYLKTHLPYFFV